MSGEELILHTNSRKVKKFALCKTLRVFLLFARETTAAYVRDVRSNLHSSSKSLEKKKRSVHRLS